MDDEEDLAGYRKGFEVSLLFNEFKLISGEGGELLKNPDGTYQNHFIEAAWRGYQMYIRHANNQLERFCETRYISPGMVTQFRETSMFEPIDEDEAHDYIRAALIVCKGTPI